jgi:hypothetical protein
MHETESHVTFGHTRTALVRIRPSKESNTNKTGCNGGAFLSAPARHDPHGAVVERKVQSKQDLIGNADNVGRSFESAFCFVQ